MAGRCGNNKKIRNDIALKTWNISHVPDSGYPNGVNIFRKIAKKLSKSTIMVIFSSRRLEEAVKFAIVKAYN